ncbi:MAG: radical SAM protein [Magnetococcales bacterium]|nr:radical SAM protein [Magnetococcales bacterium]
MDVLIIGGHFALGQKDVMRHKDDFRLTLDGVPMTLPNLESYFAHNRVLPPNLLEKMRHKEQRRPYQQIYWSGLHLYDFLNRFDLDVALLNCHYPGDRQSLALFRENPKCVVISTTFLGMESVRTLVADVRNHLPDSWIVVGGNHTHHSYQVWQRREDPLYQQPGVKNVYFFTSDNPITEIDAYIYDQHGELTLLEMIQQLKKGKRPRDLPNSVIRLKAGGSELFQFNKKVPEEYNIDAFRIAWDKIPWNYMATVVPFQTTYGCPFKCGFCNFSLTKVHKKSMDGLFEELRSITHHSFVERVWFTDDNFFLTERMVIDFCERYIQEDFPFSWASFIRASSITPRTAELLKRAKCDMLVLGFESGSQTMLDNMFKKDTVSHYHEATSYLIRAGIHIEMAFVVGYPGETAATVGESIDFVNSLPVNPEQTRYLYLFKFNLVPMSPVFAQEERDKWQLKGHWENWSHLTMNSDQANEQLQRFAMESNNTVFNYLDPGNGLWKGLSLGERGLFQRQRDDVSRAQLRFGEEAPATREAWDQLEKVVAQITRKVASGP